MTTFLDLRSQDIIAGYTFRRPAYSLAHAYLRGSSAFNDQRVLEIAKDAPGYVHKLLKEEEGRLGHFEYHSLERIAPVNVERMVDSFRMNPREANALAERMGMNISGDEKKIHLRPTKIKFKLSKKKEEKAWIFRCYDPARPLLEAGAHSFADLEQHPKYAKKYCEIAEASENSIRALDILKDVLGDDKAAFVCTSKDKDSIGFLISESQAAALHEQLEKNNILFREKKSPTRKIEQVAGHERMGGSKKGKLR